MIKSLITDPQSGKQAAVKSDGGIFPNSLAVATRDMLSYSPSVWYLTSETTGSAMNINATAGTSYDLVHDGIDTVVWTGSTITGTAWTFNSTTVHHSGTHSDYSNTASNNAVTQFAKGSSLNLNNYAQLTGWIYITYWNKPINDMQIQIYGWDTGTGLMVGNTINLSSYITISTLNSWQKFTIALSDLGLVGGSIDSIRFKTIVATGTLKFYIDDLQFVQNSVGAYNITEFDIYPPGGYWTFIYGAIFGFVDNISTSLTDGTMPKLSYDSLLGIKPDTGIVINRHNAGVTTTTFIMKTLFDLLMWGNTTMNYGYDGTTAFLILRRHYDKPLILKSEFGDYLSATISDDYSALSRMNIAVWGAIVDAKSLKGDKLI